MKKTLLSRILIAAILVLFLVLSSSVFASNEVSINTTDEDVLASYETNFAFVSGDSFKYGLDLNVNDIIDGNLFAYGGTVNIAGEVYGDVFVFANTLNISEDAIIHGNVFALATNITMSGIASDVYAVASSSFTLDTNCIIARNLNVMADSVSLLGQVSRDANISSTNGISFAKNAQEVIKGNLNYTSNNESQIADGVVTGEINFTPIETNTETVLLSMVISVISALVFSFVVIMLMLWIAPKLKDRFCDIISKKPFLSLGIGLIVFFAIIILAIILLLFTNGLGTSIAIAGFVLLMLAYSISNTVFSMSIGKLIAQKFNWNNNIVFVLLSLVLVAIITLIRYIPYVGGPIAFITAIIGLGEICINAYKRKDLVS